MARIIAHIKPPHRCRIRPSGEKRARRVSTSAAAFKIGRQAANFGRAATENSARQAALYDSEAAFWFPTPNRARTSTASRTAGVARKNFKRFRTKPKILVRACTRAVRHTRRIGRVRGIAIFDRRRRAAIRASRKIADLRSMDI